MVKKKAGTDASDTPGAQIKASAQQIWLAGMGAFARAQAEGTKRFETLVKEGGVLQKKTQSVAEDTFGEIASKMSSLAGEVQAKAGQQWGKLDSLFDDRTAKALKNLGVPTASDLGAMQARIDALEAKVASLTKARSATAKTSSAKSAKPLGKSTKTRSASAKKGVAKTALK